MHPADGYDGPQGGVIRNHKGQGIYTVTISKELLQKQR
ncbi:hypothetical protein LLE35_02760 [Neisseria gonorrhoeae]|nr:hypothetical protein [Neisseria gonorrhoeae]UYA83241.1 hypothetical protein LLE35_02760 [Neisseria gonorrhoeae]